MRALPFILVLWSCLVVHADPPATAPAHLATLCPPEWADALVYYQSFDTPDGRPEVNAAGLQLRESPLPAPGGFWKRCGMPGADGKKGRALQLAADSTALSPHHPLTIAFWWALPEDLPEQGGFSLIHLGGRGMIGHFARGGPWCGLKETAGVVQVYSLPGITNVNGIYDTHLHQSLGLKKGEWRHTAMVINAASLVSVYSDGKPVFETRNTGRAFSAEDAFKTLALGGGLAMDEIVILNRPLTAEQVAEYVTGMQQIRQAYGK